MYTHARQCTYTHIYKVSCCWGENNVFGIDYCCQIFLIFLKKSNNHILLPESGWKKKKQIFPTHHLLEANNQIRLCHTIASDHIQLHLGRCM